MYIQIFDLVLVNLGERMGCLIFINGKAVSVRVGKGCNSDPIPHCEKVNRVVDLRWVGSIKMCCI